MDFYQKFINDKAKKKRELFGKMFFPREPILLIDFSSQKNTDDLADLIAGLCDLKIHTIVIATDDKKLPHAGNIHFIPREKMPYALGAADFAVLSGGDLQIARAEGCVPISQMDGDSTVDYNPLQEHGNGFYFKNPTKWEIFASIMRALETYKFPFDWENLIRGISS